MNQHLEFLLNLDVDVLYFPISLKNQALPLNKIFFHKIHFCTIVISLNNF
jgi:hypothetical protein